MTTLIIILAYILNVFLNRWLNKIVYERGIEAKVVGFWFVPIVVSLAFICIILSNSNGNNWFTGKYWRK